MKNYMNKINILFVLFICMLFSFINVVNADMGEKPSITININNLETSNYVIDLLVYDENGSKYSGNINYNGNGEQYNESGYKHDSISESFISKLQMLHDINYDGWISESTRWDKYCLFADCRGNSNHQHYFSYFGTPEKYKIVIINNDTNEIKVTNTIEREDFKSNVTIDYNTMTVKQNGNFNIVKALTLLIATIIIELVIALLMNLKEDIKVIVLVNLITNIMLQFLLNIISCGNYLIEFIILEIIVLASEYLIYKKSFKNIEKKKLYLYVIIANIITALMTFIIK